MHTRNSYFPNNSSITIPRRRNKRRTPNVVEPELRTIIEVAPMTDNRTMEEVLQSPTEGYGEAIVILEFSADHFEIKTNLLQLVQANAYHGFERQNPHTHINNFKRMTSTLKFRGVPNDVIKLMMFSYSLEGTARVWYDKEPPNSILTWEDLVNKFVNQFFPPSKSTHLKNEISRFTQRFETFGEAWERFKEMLRACPHHGFTELTQIDTFYNGLNENDQDSLNAAAGGNLLSKTTREALQIIENKSKVRYSINKSNVSRMNMISRENASKSDDEIDRFADQISTLFDIFAKKVVTPATVKAVEESYGEMKAITTRSGVAYEGPSIPTKPSPKKVVERETEEITDKEQTNFQGSTAHIQPPVIPIPEPDKKLSLPELTPTRMTLELADRSITRPKGVSEDVFVKVGKFHFPTDFVVVDSEADPHVPLILGRSFLRTGRALIYVYGEEITLRVNDEAVTFNLNQSGNPTSTFEPIISDSSPSLTRFEGSDFILEEIEAYLKDESISLETDHADCDPEGDICLIEKLLNDDPFQLPPMDLKQGEVGKEKSSIEEPPDLELKDLPSHLEYAYLEGVDKLPVIIAKDFKVDVKEALLKVLKSYKRVIAWKITDIKGFDPRFCTHKILMEEDYKPAVQSQRWVNLKIHEVIKLLDAGMIYLISNSPWVTNFNKGTKSKQNRTKLSTKRKA
nr:reverse transcriptase domain-containing protein [Tanacetum cinerariifolium]